MLKLRNEVLGHSKNIGTVEMHTFIVLFSMHL